MSVQRPDKIHKLVITGTGRAGTTFLVRLLTELGLDTGYTAESWRQAYNPHCDAGLEHALNDPAAPYVVKNPMLCTELAGVLAGGEIVIDHALIPMRDLESAARSRIRVGGANGNIPGGVVYTSDPARQKAVLAEGFHQLAHTLAAYDIPHTLLHFPRFARDPDYTYGKLRFLLPDADADGFRAAFSRVARPDLIHDFGVEGSAVAADPALAQAYFAGQKRRRWLRRSRRYIQYAGLAAAVLLLFVARRPANVPAPAAGSLGLAADVLSAPSRAGGPPAPVDADKPGGRALQATFAKSLFTPVTVRQQPAAGSDVLAPIARSSGTSRTR